MSDETTPIPQFPETPPDDRDDELSARPQTASDPLDAETASYSDDTYPASGEAVDEALAAVASLSTLVSDRAAAAESEIVSAARAASETRTPRRRRRSTPPAIAPKRGLSSVVVGIGLVAIGGWMLATLLNGQTLDTLSLAAAGSGVVVIALLSHWLGSGRWARGGLFLVTTATAIAGVIAIALLEPTLGGISRLYPALLGAPGIGLIITAIAGRPPSARLLLPGAVLLVAAGAGMLVTFEQLPPAISALALPLAPITLALIAILLLLPLVLRGRPRRR